MQNIKKDILWRVYLVYFGVFLFGLAIIAKAAYIQFAEKDELMKKALEQEIKYFTLEANRGNILARDGSFLASSIPEFEIRMDVNSELISDKLFYDNLDSLALRLSNLFKDKSRNEYKQVLINARKESNRYFLIRNHVLYDELLDLRTFPIFRLGQYKGGLIIIQKTTRELPYRDLARRTIGFENKTENIKVGLEGAYTDILSGIDGKELRRRIHNGDWIPVSGKTRIEPQDGKDIVTTIDVNIQDVAESSLREHLEEHQAFQGCAILMEVKTGEIRAIANLRYDPEDGQYKESYNYAIGESVEPGSTFKLASLIAALEDKKTSLEDLIDIGNGKATYYNRTMEDVHKFPRSIITVREAFEQSSNVGISTLIFSKYQYSPESYVAQIKRIGIDKPLNIEIPGEGKPVVKDPSDKPHWYGTTLPWMSIGYEVTMTPLQLLTLYNSIANNGVMVKPMFVTQIQDGGTVVRNIDPVVLNPKVCSPESTRELKSLMEGVVERGTATRLKESVYKIAGKTGTALVADKNKGYGQKIYNASFVGYFPADDPKYSCIVVVNNPTSGKIYGGAVAAPVFKEIADKVYATQLDIHKKESGKIKAEPGLPMVMNGSYEDLKKCFAKVKYVADIPSDSPWVKSDTVENKIEFKSFTFSTDTIPDMTGMSVRDAVYILEKIGMKPVIRGKGTVSMQSVPSGSPVSKGAEIILFLKNGQDEDA